MEKFTKNCPRCNNIMEYRNLKLLRQSLRRNSKCAKCIAECTSLRLTGIPLSEESKKKMSLAKKGTHLSVEHKNNISKAGRGRVFSHEHIQRLSESKTGDKNPSKQYWVREKIRNSVNKMYIEHPEVKEKISLSMKKFIKEHPDCMDSKKAWGINQFSDKYTSIELKVKEILDALGIEYTHNEKIGRYWTDFLFLDNKVIEADGIYWHDKERDNRKDKFLNGRGFLVLRLTEHNINRNIDEVRRIITQYVKQ